MFAALNEWLVGTLNSALLAISERRNIEGIDVRLAPVDKKQATDAWPRIEDAIAYLRHYWPLGFDRLREHVRVILIDKMYDQALGEWRRHGRVIVVALEDLQNPRTHPVHLAATLVHEVAHARLEAYGIEYTRERRHRIEAICFRSQAAFSRRVPRCEKLTAHYESLADWALDADNATWSDAEFRERSRRRLRALNAEMRDLGVPAFVTDTLDRVVTRALDRSREPGSA